MVNAHGRQGGGGAMGRDRVIVVILAVGVMHRGPSTVERAKRSRDFGGETNKSISPLCAFQSVEITHSPLNSKSLPGFRQ